MMTSTTLAPSMSMTRLARVARTQRRDLHGHILTGAALVLGLAFAFVAVL